MLLVLFAVTSWLVLYPGSVAARILRLHDFFDMDFKMLLVALAALNFLMSFVAEVSETILWTLVDLREGRRKNSWLGRAAVCDAEL